jgi:predicted transcriptional regulator
MELQKQLKIAGLNHSEITVYLFLLENGLSTPPAVSRGTKIARTNCYNVLEELQNKGLIEEQTVGKRKAYLAKDPDALIRALEQKKEAIAHVLPDLRGLYTLQKNKPKIRYYDGLEQVKEIYLSTLVSTKVYGIGSTSKLVELMPEFYQQHLEQVRDRGIVWYDILSHSSQVKGAPEMKTVLRGLYDARFLPQKYQDFPTDMLIWDDNIALITLEEPIFGTVLTNKLLAKTFGIIFDVMWNATDVPQEAPIFPRPTGEG